MPVKITMLGRNTEEIRAAYFGTRVSLQDIRKFEKSDFEIMRINYNFKSFNSLLNDKNSDWSKLKVFAENKINVTEKLKFVSGTVENIVGKEKMLVTSIFSFSHNVFKRLFIQGH